MRSHPNKIALSSAPGSSRIAENQVLQHVTLSVQKNDGRFINGSTNC